MHTTHWIIVFIALLGQTAPLPAAAPGDALWPCIQRKVPTLSAGTMWSGPPIDQAIAAWRDDKEVAAMVARLVSRRTSLDEAAKLVNEFSSTLKENKAGRLTLLFAGVFNEINSLRSEIIKAIERFTINQRRRAKEIQETRKSLDALKEKAIKTGADEERAGQIETQLTWQMRIYEERESTLTYICETPGLLEQRAFAIGRTIQNAMN